MRNIPTSQFIDVSIPVRLVVVTCTRCGEVFAVRADVAQCRCPLGHRTRTSPLQATAKHTSAVTEAELVERITGTLAAAHRKRQSPETAAEVVAGWLQADVDEVQELLSGLTLPATSGDVRELVEHFR